MTREKLLVETFVGLADTLVDAYDIIDFMQTLAERGVELLDVSAAGIMLADSEGNLRHAACSSEQMRLVEFFELQVEEGPCFDAFRENESVLCASPEDADDPVAPVRSPRARGQRLPRGVSGADAAALAGDRCAQPVLVGSRGAQRGRPRASRRRWRTSPRSGSCTSVSSATRRDFSSQLEFALESRDRDRAGQGNRGRAHPGRASTRRSS